VIEIGVVLTVFALVFVAELPDKTAIAGLVLGTRFPVRWVFAGIATAFLAHVVIALAAGQVLSLLPEQPLKIVVAALFALGAFMIWREGSDDDEEDEAQATEIIGESEGALGLEAHAEPSVGNLRVASLGFLTIFLAEWGDLTQIMTANLAAKYDNPLSVGIGAVLALWSVSLLAILFGSTLLKVLPIKVITRVAAAVMVGLSLWRSEERRVGKECRRLCRSRWSPYH
jgi:putative Ca2+/H+ antiporter (TMEM165/GDT1 family)